MFFLPFSRHNLSEPNETDIKMIARLRGIFRCEFQRGPTKDEKVTNEHKHVGEVKQQHFTFEKKSPVFDRPYLRKYVFEPNQTDIKMIARPRGIHRYDFERDPTKNEKITTLRKMAFEQTPHFTFENRQI